VSADPQGRAVLRQAAEAHRAARALAFADRLSMPGPGALRVERADYASDQAAPWVLFNRGIQHGDLCRLGQGWWNGQGSEGNYHGHPAWRRCWARLRRVETSNPCTPGGRTALTWTHISASTTSTAKSQIEAALVKVTIGLA